MSSIIRATTTSGLQITPDNSGSLQFQTNGTTAAVTIDTSQNATFAAQATIPTINLTGGQITFPATQSSSANANTLDDYEEGTWTSTISSSSGTITSYTVNSATYTKIGRLVNVNISITITNNGTGGSAVVFTLPFQSSTNSIGAGRENAATGHMLQILASNGSSNATVYNYANGYPGGTNYNLICTATYFV
jgi:hypothetical protein